MGSRVWPSQVSNLMGFDGILHGDKDDNLKEEETRDILNVEKLKN